MEADGKEGILDLKRKLRERNNSGRGDGKYKILLNIVLIIIIILILIIVYFFIAKPRFNDYITNKQLEAKDLTLLTIIQQIQQQGYTQITMGNETLTLAPYQGGGE